PIRAHIISTAAISGHVRSAVQRSLVPSCAPATEYVAMPDGSSSAAPVITPGPSDLNSNRIQRTGANVGTNESECVPFLRIKARIRSQSYMARRTNRLFKVVQCDQTSILDIKHRITRCALSVNGLFFCNRHNFPAFTDG